MLLSGRGWAFMLFPWIDSLHFLPRMVPAPLDVQHSQAIELPVENSSNRHLELHVVLGVTTCRPVRFSASKDRILLQ